MTTTATAHAEAVSPAVAAIDHLDALKAEYAENIGTDSIVVRDDLGIVIAYASTADYMLEARATADGRRAYRVNLNWYASAEDIPATYRKARAIAKRVEVTDVTPLLDAKAAHTDAYQAYRATGL